MEFWPFRKKIREHFLIRKDFIKSRSHELYEDFNFVRVLVHKRYGTESKNYIFKYSAEICIMYLRVENGLMMKLFDRWIDN